MAGFIKVENEDSLISYLQSAKGKEESFLYQKGARTSVLQTAQVAGKATVLHYDLDGRPMANDITTALLRAIPGVEIADVSREERHLAMQHSGGRFDFATQERVTVESAQD